MDVHARLSRLEATQARFALRLDDCWQCQEAASGAISLRLTELQARINSRAASEPKQVRSSAPAPIAERFELSSARLSGLQSPVEDHAAPERG